MKFKKHKFKMYNHTTKMILNEEIIISDTFLKRLKGLMFKKKFKKGMLFKNLKGNSSIHTCFMKFTIDVYFIDENNTIYEITRLKPWKYYKPSKKAKYVLEYESSKKRYEKNDKIELISV